MFSTTPAPADPEVVALAGFLAGYAGRTREAYALDLRQYLAWCSACQLLFDDHCTDIELYARDLEEHGRARTTGRRLLTIAGFYRYAAEEGLIEHSPAVHVRRPRLDYESHAVWASTATSLAFLVAAGVSSPQDHALSSLLALNGLRISEALGATSTTSARREDTAGYPAVPSPARSSSCTLRRGWSCARWAQRRVLEGRGRSVRACSRRPASGRGGDWQRPAGGSRGHPAQPPTALL